MKKLSFILAALFLQVAAMAQSIILQFDGGNANTTNGQNFTVDIDGTRYYSINATPTGNARARQLEINNLPLGSHTIKVYRNNNNSAVSNTGTDAPLYSNAFQLRTGYDMVIGIRRNGQVSFSEKRNTTAATQGARGQAAMTDAKFNTLLQSIKAKWAQSTRYTSVKSAFTNRTNYFTTDQAGQLLMLVTSEAKKLELAKLAYPRIVDPEHFMDVTELFNAQASKDNLEQFYRTKNPQYDPGTTDNNSNNTNNTNNNNNSNNNNNNSTPNNNNYSHQPMSNQQFNQLAGTVNNQYQQAGKYAVIHDAFNIPSNYFTTAQIRQLLTLITMESDRLTLAKLAHARTADPANFSSLYNLFSTQAMREELDNHIRYGGTVNTNTPGEYSNRVAMTATEFSALQLKVRLHFRQASVVQDVREAFTNNMNWFTLEQTRALLTYVLNETDRLAMAKLAYHRVTDPTTFHQLSDLFTTQAARDELNKYIRSTKS